MEYLSPDLYKEAMVNYLDLCFKQSDPELAQGIVVKDPRDPRFPLTISGNFAIVFAIESRSRKYAIRLFTRSIAQLSERYRQISQTLPTLPPDLAAHFVDFKYREGLPSQGICIQGKWYPYVKMEWVSGDNLKNYVGKLCAKVAASPQELGAVKGRFSQLAHEWHNLMVQMQQCQIAHGDLQSANILIDTGGQIRLIDYDGMYVPALKGLESVGIGVAGYQHPGRQLLHFHERLDNFSALAIYLVLYALSGDPNYYVYNPDPRLIRAFGKVVGDDDLLFGSQDFQQPQHSTALKILQNAADRLLAHLARQIATICQAPFDRIPDFKMLVDPQAFLADALQRLEKAISANEVREIVSIWSGEMIQFAPAQQHRPTVENALRLVAFIDDLVKQYRQDPQNDAAFLGRLSSIPGLTDHPALKNELVDGVPLAGIVKRAQDRLQALREVENAIAQQEQRWKAIGLWDGVGEHEIVNLWTRHKTLLEFYAAAQSRRLLNRVQQAEKRLQNFDAFEKAIQSRNPRLIEKLWATGLKLYQPAQQYQPQVEHAYQEIAYLENIKRFYQREPENDAALLNAWQANPSLANPLLAQKELIHGMTLAYLLQRAQERVAAMQNMVAVIERQAQQFATNGYLLESLELEILACWSRHKHLLNRYRPLVKAGISARVEEADRRVAQFKTLVATVEKKQPQQIVEVWRKSNLLSAYAPVLPYRPQIQESLDIVEWSDRSLPQVQTFLKKGLWDEALALAGKIKERCPAHAAAQDLFTIVKAYHKQVQDLHKINLAYIQDKKFTQGLRFLDKFQLFGNQQTALLTEVAKLRHNILLAQYTHRLAIAGKVLLLLLLLGGCGHTLFQFYLYSAGTAYMAEQKYVEALSYLRQCSSPFISKPKLDKLRHDCRISILIIKGRQAIENGDYEKAVSLYQQLLPDCPELAGEQLRKLKELGY